MSTTLLKNVASQRIRVYAYTPADGLPKTGDAANLTAYIAKDYGAVTALTDTSATEEDATNAPGFYWFDITQTETNADNILVSGKSATSGVKVLGAPAVIGTRPATGFLAPATAGRTLVVDASGLADANTVKLGPSGSGTAQTARDIGASVLLSSGTGTGQLDFTSGVVKSNLTQVGGTAQSATDLKDFADTGYDPSTHKVQGVVLVDTTTTNTDMRGTDSAFLAASAPTNFGALAITAGGIVQADLQTIKTQTVTCAAGVTILASVGTASTSTAQTGDAYARLGAPAGASVSADVAAVKVDTAAILIDTDTTIPATLTSMSGATFDTSTDSLEAIRNNLGGGSTSVSFRGVVTKSGSTYYVSFVGTVSGAMIAGASLSSLVCTFYDEDGTDLVFSGTPTAHSTGIVYASGTLTTAPPDNRPVIVKIGATYGGTAYSDVLAGVNLA